ncbi:MAG: glycosyltransferase family 4 protein [Bacteroidota bacterium]
MGKRIGFFISDSKWKNYHRWAYNTSKALYAEGYDVYVITPRKSKLYSRLKGYGMKVISYKKSGFMLMDLYRLSRICKGYKLDNLVINYPDDIRISALVAKYCSLEKLVFRRGTVPIKSRNGLDNHLAKKYISTVITNSRANKDAIRENKSSVFRNKPIEVVYNGIQEKSVSRDKREFDYHQNGELIVGLSNCANNRTFCKKFFEYLKKTNIDKERITFLIFPDWKHDSSFSGKVKQISSAGSVRLTGQETHLSEFMSKVDVYLSPLVENSFNYSLIYAMAQKKPVIGISGGSNPEIIGDQENGFLIEDDNFDELIEKIETLRDDRLRESMGENGFRTVENTFNFRQSAHQIQRILSSGD